LVCTVPLSLSLSYIKQQNALSLTVTSLPALPFFSAEPKASPIETETETETNSITITAIETTILTHLPPPFPSPIPLQQNASRTFLLKLKDGGVLPNKQLCEVFVLSKADGEEVVSKASVVLDDGNERASLTTSLTSLTSLTSPNPAFSMAIECESPQKIDTEFTMTVKLRNLTNKMLDIVVILFEQTSDNTNTNQLIPLTLEKRVHKIRAEGGVRDEDEVVVVDFQLLGLVEGIFLVPQVKIFEVSQGAPRNRGSELSYGLCPRPEVVLRALE